MVCLKFLIFKWRTLTNGNKCLLHHYLWLEISRPWKKKSKLFVSNWGEKEFKLTLCSSCHFWSFPIIFSFDKIQNRNEENFAKEKICFANEFTTFTGLNDLFHEVNHYIFCEMEKRKKVKEYAHCVSAQNITMHAQLMLFLNTNASCVSRTKI